MSARNGTSKSNESAIHKRGLLNSDMRFEFGREGRSGMISDNSLGNYLKSVFSTSSAGDVPAEIQQQFSNNTPVPKDLFVFSPAAPRSPAPSSSNINDGPQMVNVTGREDSPLVERPDARLQTRLNPLADAAAAASSTTQQDASASQIQTSAISSAALPGQDSTKHLEITEYLNMPQAQAAKAVNLAPSTFSKRWKEAAPTRKWPWRTLRKLDKQITTLLHNIPPGGQIPEDIEVTLMALLRQRQEELKPVIIRM